MSSSNNRLNNSRARRAPPRQLTYDGKTIWDHRAAGDEPVCDTPDWMLVDDEVLARVGGAKKRRILKQTMEACPATGNLVPCRHLEGDLWVYESGGQHGWTVSNRAPGEAQGRVEQVVQGDEAPPGLPMVSLEHGVTVAVDEDLNRVGQEAVRAGRQLGDLGAVTCWVMVAEGGDVRLDHRPVPVRRPNDFLAVLAHNGEYRGCVAVNQAGDRAWAAACTCLWKAR